MAKERKIDMVILGLLSHEDLTGYDIKKRIDGAISFFWKGSFGNIYPALKDMETQGLLIKNDTSVGGRERITYKITEAGINTLKNWLKEEQVENELAVKNTDSYRKQNTIFSYPAKSFSTISNGFLSGELYMLLEYLGIPVFNAQIFSS